MSKWRKARGVIEELPSPVACECVEGANGSGLGLRLSLSFCSAPHLMSQYDSYCSQRLNPAFSLPQTIGDHSFGKHVDMICFWAILYVVASYLREQDHCLMCACRVYCVLHSKWRVPRCIR